MLKIIVFSTAIEADQYCAQRIINKIKQNKNCCAIGFATGSTFMGVYRLLGQDAHYKTDWSRVISFNLDEYIDTQPHNPWGYEYFMNEQLFKFINIKKENIHFPEANFVSSTTCAEYSQAYQKANIAISLIGVGLNGHIAFNEPGSAIDSITRRIELAQTTLQHNADLFFHGDINKVPKAAISVGIQDILSAQTLIAAAYGSGKKAIIARFCQFQDVSAECPLTYLRTHDDSELLLDQAAAADINWKKLPHDIIVERR